MSADASPASCLLSNFSLVDFFLSLLAKLLLVVASPGEFMHKYTTSRRSSALFVESFLA